MILTALYCVVLMAAIRVNRREAKKEETETEKCKTTCNSKDLGRFKNQLQKSLQQIDTFGASTLLDETVKLGWLEGLRCARP